MDEFMQPLFGTLDEKNPDEFMIQLEEGFHSD